jgi:hypothetical protein
MLPSLLSGSHINRDREGPHGLPPPTPPDVRVTYPAVRQIPFGCNTPQRERHLPVCQPRVHPRGRASPGPSPDAISPLHNRQRLSSTVQAFSTHSARLLCPLLTSARRSGRIPPPSVPCEDTPQISRGKLSYLPCISARFIKHSPLWMEDFTVACPLVPTVPHLVSGSCPSPRTCVPRFLQTPPRGDALALPLSFGSTHTWTGDFHPQA